MGILKILFMNIQDALSTKTPAQRRQEVINAVVDLEYYASRMELAALKLNLSGDPSNIKQMQDAYETTANKIALNLLALEKIQGIDASLEEVIQNNLTPQAARYAEAVKKIFNGGNF